MEQIAQWFLFCDCFQWLDTSQKKNQNPQKWRIIFYNMPWLCCAAFYSDQIQPSEAEMRPHRPISLWFCGAGSWNLWLLCELNSVYGETFLSGNQGTFPLYHTVHYIVWSPKLITALSTHSNHMFYSNIFPLEASSTMKMTVRVNSMRTCMSIWHSSCCCSSF